MTHPPSPQPEKSPAHQPTGAGFVSDDDIDLPPPETPAPQRDDVGRPDDAGNSWGSGFDSGSRPGGAGGRGGDGGALKRAAAGLVAAVAVVGAGWLFFANDSTGSESNHPNWPHVQAADNAPHGLVELTRGGPVENRPAIEVSLIDADPPTTTAVQWALAQGDMQAVKSKINAAQQPSGSATADVEVAELTPDSEIVKSLKEPETKFYRLTLLDCCDEDGDVVEVIINGESFLTVPIMHEGATLSIPLSHGTNSVAVRGVSDGGGGITIALHSSRGKYFIGRLSVGEEYPVEVVTR